MVQGENNAIKKPIPSFFMLLRKMNNWINQISQCSIYLTLGWAETMVTSVLPQATASFLLTPSSILSFCVLLMTCRTFSILFSTFLPCTVSLESPRSQISKRIGYATNSFTLGWTTSTGHYNFYKSHLRSYIYSSSNLWDLHPPPEKFNPSPARQGRRCRSNQ